MYGGLGCINHCFCIFVDNTLSFSQACLELMFYIACNSWLILWGKEDLWPLKTELKNKVCHSTLEHSISMTAKCKCILQRFFWLRSFLEDSESCTVTYLFPEKPLSEFPHPHSACNAMKCSRINSFVFFFGPTSLYELKTMLIERSRGLLPILPWTKNPPNTH